MECLCLFLKNVDVSIFLKRPEIHIINYTKISQTFKRRNIKNSMKIHDSIQITFRTQGNGFLVVINIHLFSNNQNWGVTQICKAYSLKKIKIK